MLKDRLQIIFFLVSLILMQSAFATDYFINNASGNDANIGTVQINRKNKYRSFETW
jgi:hypothetical protein